MFYRTGKTNQIFGFMMPAISLAKQMALHMALSGLLFLCVTQQAFANILPKETLKVASRINTPPYVFGEFEGGIDMEILKAIEDHSNLRFEYIHIPRNRILVPFSDSNLDGFLIQPKETSGDGCLTDWYIQHLDYAITLKREKLKISHVNDLSVLRVISFDGATKFLTAAFRNAVKNNPNYIESYHQRSHIQSLYKGRFDAIVGDHLILKHHQKSHFENTGEFHPIETHNILPPVRLAARFRHKQHCDIFNTALRAIRENGTYNAILQKFENEILAVSAGKAP